MAEQLEIYVGLDVSRDKLDLAVVDARGQKVKEGVVDNEPSGWAKLVRLIGNVRDKLGASSVVCAMESTSDFHQHPSRVLREAGISVRVVNPVMIKAFAKARLKDIKTDRGDALLIAEHVRVMGDDLQEWAASEELDDLRLLTRTRRDEIEQRTLAKNRLHKLMRRYFPGYRTVLGASLTERVVRAIAKYPSPHLILAASDEDLLELSVGGGRVPFIAKLRELAGQAARPELPGAVQRAFQSVAQRIVDLDAELASLDADIEEMLKATFPDQQLTSIPGVGPVTAATVLAEVGDIGRFPTREQFVGYCGLYPIIWESGAVRRTYRMTWKGNKNLKTALLLASVSARRHNPAVRAVYERLRSRGKSGRAAGGAAARKLAEYVFVVLSQRKPWDPDRAQASIEKGRTMSLGASTT